MKVKFKSMEELIETVKDKVDEISKIAFLVAFFSTIFCHLIFFVNGWANEDSLFGSVVERHMLSSGRWMPGNILSEFVSPIVLMVIVAVVLGIIAVLVCRMFDIRSKSYARIIALLLTTFPVLSMSFGYSFMIERYMGGLLLAVLAVYITNKFKWGFIIGGILLSLSLGYYQAYITVSITLVLMLALLKLLENKDVKEFWRYILKCLAMGVIGVAIYLFVVKIAYNIIGIELLDYKGMNNMGSIPPIREWLYLVKRTYGHVIYFLLGGRFYNPGVVPVIVQAILVISSAVCIFKIVLNNEKRKMSSIITLVVLLVVFPFGMNILDFLMYETHISTLNIYQFVFMFILPFVLLNFWKKGEYKDKKIINFLELSCIICALVVIWSNFSLNNIYYAKMGKYNEQTILLTNRIFARIEGYPNVTSETKVLIGNKNGIYGIDDSSVYDNRILFDQGLWAPFIGYSTEADYSDYKFHAISQNLIGLSYKPVTSEDRKEILESSEYDNMPSWPNAEAIKFIGDVLVVKLS